MTETNSCIEKDVLIDYLYGEADAGARTRVEAHVRNCAQCADEVRGLKDVRGTLEVWVPPEAELGFRVVSDAHPEPAPVSFWGRLRRPPVWGLATAAVLVLAVAAAIVRPEMEIGRGGMVLRIGWSEIGSEPAAQPAVVPVSPSDQALPGAPRQEIEAVRGTPVAAGSRSRDFRSAPRGADVFLGSGGAAADEWLLRVNQLISASEQRQGRAPDARVLQVEEFAEQWLDDLTELQRVFAEFEVTPELSGPQLLEYLRRVVAITGARAGTIGSPRP